MAESGVIVLDDFGDGGAKWSFVGDPGVTYTVAADAANAGTALGNLAATRTLKYTFATPATGRSQFNCSLLLTLPGAVDVGAATYLCADVWYAAGQAASFTLGPYWRWTTTTGHYDNGMDLSAGGDWAIGRDTVAALVAAAGGSLVTSVTLNLELAPSSTFVLSVDTVRACNYAYSADDMRLFGRRPGPATNAQVDALLNAAMTYLFGSATGEPTGMPAGMQMDATRPNYGAFRNWNPFSGGELDGNAAGPEADMATVSGALLQGLVMLSRMTGLAGYLDGARWLIEHYLIAWTDLRPGSVSYGFMPYSVGITGQRNADTSTDQYQMAVMGVLDFWIADGRRDQEIVTLITAWWTWWRTGQQTGHYFNYEGAEIAGFGSLGGMPGVLWAAKQFMASGDGGGYLDGNGNPQGQTAFDAVYDPALFGPSYRTDYLAAGGHSAWGLGYNTVTLREPIVMNRWSRTKLTLPAANLTALVQENWLAQAVGAPYYNTDLPGDFNKRSLLAFTPTEAAAVWDSTTKQWGITAQGPTDACDTAGQQEDFHYLADALRDLPGGDVPALIAAGTAGSFGFLGSLDTAMRELAQKGLIAPGDVWDGLPVRALRGLYAWYTNNQGQVRNAWLTTLDFHTVGHLIGMYAWWYQYFRFTGLWPEIGGRVLDWSYEPGSATLRLLVNGRPGDAVAIPLHGLQAGQRYVARNLATGAQLLAAGGAYTLTWTLTQPEETWLVYNLVQPAVRGFASGAGTPRTAFAS